MKTIVKKLFLSCALLTFGVSQISALSVIEFIENIENGRIPMYGRNRLVLSSAGLTSLEGLDHILQQKPQIRELYLENNNITHIPEHIFDHAQNLQRLNLSNNRLTKIPEGTFSNTPQLQMLDLSNNRISELPHTIFANLPNLRNLNLIDNPLNPEFLPTFIIMVQNIPNLQILNNETVGEALKKLFLPTLKNRIIKYLMENLQTEEYEDIAEKTPTAFDILPLSQEQRQAILDKVEAKKLAAQQTT